MIPAFAGTASSRIELQSIICHAFFGSLDPARNIRLDCTPKFHPIP
jgi:hypothetical protein